MTTSSLVRTVQDLSDGWLIISVFIRRGEKERLCINKTTSQCSQEEDLTYFFEINSFIISRNPIGNKCSKQRKKK